MPRDEFPEAVRHVVAERAGYLCSNPTCRRLTVGPHSIAEKSLTTGVVAHISGASPGGPRYRPDQTAEERSAIENALWLCHVCSDLVDKDSRAYPEQLLQSWRAAHEEFIRPGGGYPRLPTVMLRTLRGLSVPAPPAGMSVTITGDDNQRYRQHDLELVNSNGRELRFLRARLQLGEPAVASDSMDVPPGISVACAPEHVQTVTWGTPGSSATYQPGDGASPNLRLAIDPVPPGIPLRILVTSRPDTIPMGLPDAAEGLRMKELRYFMQGSFLYQWYGEMIERRFLVPFMWDPVRRAHASEPAEELGMRSLVLTRRF